MAYTKAQALAAVHKSMCDDPACGYNQGGNRIGKTPAKTRTILGRTVSVPSHDMDCSSSVALAIWVVFGVIPFTYTGNERSGLAQYGWKAHSVDVHNCWDGYRPKAGDVVLRDSGHTAMFQDAGKTISEFTVNEKGTITGGAAGDQTGKESKTTAYSSTKAWDWILECPSGTWVADAKASSSGTVKVTAGKYKCVIGTLNVRSQPSTSSSIVAKYSKGETVNLDGWSKVSGGITWGRYTSYSGKTRYIAVAEDGTAYLVKA